jgi:hypothetical protein
VTVSLSKTSNVTYINIGGHFNFMTRLFFIPILILTFNRTSGQNSQFPAGLVYGPKAAFEISAPEDWILDNKAGLSSGLPCVLYLANSSWQQSPVIMYAKIASPTYKTVKEFTEFAYAEWKKLDPNFKRERLGNVSIDKTYAAVVFKYVGGQYGSYETTAYVQVENAVCYVVLSAKNETDYIKYADALIKTIKTFKYTPAYIGFSRD